MTTTQPVRIACVGRTNEGKSSIVAALSENDRIQISDSPGTTRQNEVITCQVDGQPLLSLYDTPGFEDAEAVLFWLQEHNEHAAQRPATVKSFLQHHKGSNNFIEEQTLLSAIMENETDILYIVDGSHPFNADFEAEMEVLQWCGRPRMALINPKHGETYIADWKLALGQYFSVVRVFDAHDATWTPRLELLKAFRELQDTTQRRDSVDHAIKLLNQQQTERPLQASQLILETLVTCCTSQEEQRYTHQPPTEKELQGKLCKKLEIRWHRHQKEMEDLYRHHIHSRQVQGIDPQLFTADLFNQKSWEIFGLSKSSLALLGGIVGVSSGAPIGGMIDLHTGGASFLGGTVLGSLIGGGAGAVAAIFAGEQLGQMKILGQSVSQHVAKFGPISNPRFPWILLDLILLHYTSISKRSHARRDSLEVSHSEQNPKSMVEDISSSDKQVFEQMFKTLRSQDSTSIEKERPKWLELIQRTISKE